MSERPTGGRTTFKMLLTVFGVLGVAVCVLLAIPSQEAAVPAGDPVLESLSSTSFVVFGIPVVTMRGTAGNPGSLGAVIGLFALGVVAAVMYVVRRGVW